MLNIWQFYYKRTIKGKTFSLIQGNEKDLSYWQDLLFFNFLYYCLPVSFIAAIPSLVMALKEGYRAIAFVDVLGLVLLAIVTFVHQIPLEIRKRFVIAIGYLVGIVLIVFWGYIGPGVFYLFAITILSALVFPGKFGYYTIIANVLILSFFAVNIQLKLFDSALRQEYTMEKWIAYSCNFVFLSVVLVALINRIFKSLQDTINKQVNTEMELYDINLKIKKSEANLSAIFESSVDGFILLDEDFNIRAFNTKAKQYVLLSLGHADFEAGQSILNYVEPAKLNYFRSVIQKALSGETIEYDRMHIRAGNKVQWIRYTFTPVDEDGVIKGACIAGRDVTVRRMYLQNVEDQNKTFRKIAWMQSHVVRAPLARLMGLIGLLKTSRDDDFEQAIDYILISAHELDDIINKITQESHAIINKYPAPVDTSIPNKIN